MDGRKLVGAWRTGAAAVGVVAVLLVGIQLTGWPGRPVKVQPSGAPPGVFEIHAIEPDVPVVVDEDDAAALAEAWLGKPGQVARVDGPINLPAGAGPHWVVTLIDDKRLVVGVLLGNVARLDVALRVLQPTPIPSTRLTIAEARELAFATIGERVTNVDSNASIDQSMVLGRAFWCGQVGARQQSFVCVDMVERKVYGQAEVDDLNAANEELNAAFWAANAAFERATAAYRLVRALGPADRLVAFPVTPPPDLEGTAAAAGLETTSGVNGLEILGPWRDVLAVLTDLPATEILLEEDRDALRPIRADVGPVPRPAVAYASWPTEARAEVIGTVEMPPEQVAEALTWIARSLRPADGRPYDRLSALTLCDTERSCAVTVWGALLGAGEDRYDFQVTVGDPIRLFRADYQAVPRPMVQEAERIARRDPLTAALIGTYQTIGAVVWDPAAPSRLVITYERTPPGEAAAPDAPTAATTTLVDRLLVTVDVLAGRVVSTSEVPADQPTV